VLSLELPPLRQREGDIQRLLDHFLSPHWTMDPEAERTLAAYAWPGNVRQLINAIERAKIMAEGDVIHVADLPPDVRQVRAAGDWPATQPTDDLASIERGKVIEVLRRVAGNKTRAAKALGVDRRKIYRLMEKYGIGEGELAGR
jgi:DNA-binding NtrC family response regulator